MILCINYFTIIIVLWLFKVLLEDTNCIWSLVSFEFLWFLRRLCGFFTCVVTIYFLSCEWPPSVFYVCPSLNEHFFLLIWRENYRLEILTFCNFLLKCFCSRLSIFISLLSCYRKIRNFLYSNISVIVWYLFYCFLLLQS